MNLGIIVEAADLVKELWLADGLGEVDEFTVDAGL